MTDYVTLNQNGYQIAEEAAERAYQSRLEELSFDAALKLVDATCTAIDRVSKIGPDGLPFISDMINDLMNASSAESSESASGETQSEPASTYDHKELVVRIVENETIWGMIRRREPSVVKRLSFVS